jgi:hypothetical protein
MGSRLECYRDSKQPCDTWHILYMALSVQAWSSVQTPTRRPDPAFTPLYCMVCMHQSNNINALKAHTCAHVDNKQRHAALSTISDNITLQLSLHAWKASRRSTVPAWCQRTRVEVQPDNEALLRMHTCRAASFHSPVGLLLAMAAELRGAHQRSMACQAQCIPKNNWQLLCMACKQNNTQDK